MQTIELEKITLTVDEAAKMLGVGRNVMLDLAKLDGFPAVKFNRRILINKAELINWFNRITLGKINAY